MSCVFLIIFDKYIVCFYFILLNSHNNKCNKMIVDRLADKWASIAAESNLIHTSTFLTFSKLVKKQKSRPPKGLTDKGLSVHYMYLIISFFIYSFILHSTQGWFCPFIFFLPCMFIVICLFVLLKREAMKCCCCSMTHGSNKSLLVLQE